MDINVNVVGTNGFLEIKRSLLYALNVKVLIGIDQGGRSKMVKKKVSFWVTEIKKVPIKVKFKTKEGETISFDATKIKRIPKKVTFETKRKRK